MLQKNILEQGEVIEVPRKPIRISYKVYTITHVKDVEGDEEEKATYYRLVIEGVTMETSRDIYVGHTRSLGLCRL